MSNGLRANLPYMCVRMRECAPMCRNVMNFFSYIFPRPYFNFGLFSSLSLLLLAAYLLPFIFASLLSLSFSLPFSVFLRRSHQPKNFSSIAFGSSALLARRMCVLCVCVHGVNLIFNGLFFLVSAARFSLRTIACVISDGKVENGFMPECRDKAQRKQQYVWRVKPFSMSSFRAIFLPFLYQLYSVLGVVAAQSTHDAIQANGFLRSSYRFVSLCIDSIKIRARVASTNRSNQIFCQSIEFKARAELENNN